MGEGMKKFILFVSFLFIGCINGNDNLIPKGLGVPFQEGMSSSRWFKHSWVQTNNAWKQVKNLYDTYISSIEYDSQPRIPKTIHQIWLGSPFPKKYLAWQKSWQKYHPDWEYKLWTDKDVEEFGLINKKWFDQARNYGQKADIARYEILYRLGGVYVDTDFECLQPFDILHHTCDFYVGIAQETGFKLFNGLIGSVPGNPILKECIETMDPEKKLHASAHINIIHTTGPFLLTRCFLKKVKDSGKCVAFPSNYFYPWPIDRRKDRRQIERWIKKESFAIHCWAESWVNQPAR